MNIEFKICKSAAFIAIMEALPVCTGPLLDFLSVVVQSEALSAPLMRTIGQFCVFCDRHSMSVNIFHYQER